MENLFLHLDLNNFYASVECKRHPDCADKPVAVAGDPTKRHGIVLAKNQVAKAYGVKTGDTIWEAMSKAPGIIFFPPNFSDYDSISKNLFKICNDYTCYVEPFGPDECWMDCSGSTKLFGAGNDIADTLRERVKSELGITASVGVSFTKIFAKLGSDMKKPDATTVIDRDNFKNKVWPLSADEMCGVGSRIYSRLNKMNINTIGDLAHADERVIKAAFGKVGIDLKKMAAGEESGSVREAVIPREQKSIGHGLTALRNLTTKDDITTLVYYLSELIAARIKRHGMRGNGIAVHLRSAELEHCSKRTTLPRPICSSNEIAENALKLIWEISDGRPLRSLDISVFDLCPMTKTEQLSFFDNSLRSAAQESLDKAIEHIRGKYGKNVLLRGSHIDTDIIMEKDVGDFLPFKR